MNKSIPNNKIENSLNDVTTYQAGVLQASSHRAVQKFCDDVLRQYGITKMQWMIIGTVLDNGKAGIRITDLAEKMDTTLAYLTNTVNLLESKSILARKASADDNRSKLVHVHPKFVRQCKEIEKTLRQALRSSIYDEVEPSDFLIYMKVLRQLAQVKPIK